jgi:16S rRNA (cytosine1402-N4)-methyltransferase
MEHIPVLTGPLLASLQVRNDGTYLDATLGLGGHTGAIARLLTSGRVIACDRDEESIAKARENTRDCADRIQYCHCRFSELERALREAGAAKVNGLIADLGVSRYQLTDAARGFSFMSKGPLDMRLSRSQELTAADIVNFSSEKDIAALLERGEERRSRRVARAIVRGRPFTTTESLAKAISDAVPRIAKIHPATLTFQALRMEVNEEREELEALLELAPKLVADGGRIAIIAFHSLEDRQVKQRFAQLVRAGEARYVVKKPVVPSDEEVSANPASRSAKMRVIEMGSGAVDVEEEDEAAVE